jgi:hypothetical protein
MKTFLNFISTLLCTVAFSAGQDATPYINQLAQVQIDPKLPESEWPRWYAQIPDEGERESLLAIDPGGARFELWTIFEDANLTRHLLDTKYVSTYTPVADLMIVTEDPYKEIPRTRADRPFDVYIQPNGLRNDAEAPDAAKRVHVMRHVQSYGEDGNADSIDRTQAQLVQEVYLTENTTHHYTFPINAIPAADRTKVRGEECFSVYTIDDYQAEPSQLARMYVQVWPIARGAITGLTNGQLVRFDTPNVTVTLEDLYPDSSTYVQLYSGAPTLGTEGREIVGRTFNEAVPQDLTLVLNKWDTMIDQDGQWTIEVLTKTPFGIDRLAYVTFNVDRSIEVQGTVTTLDQ